MEHGAGHEREEEGAWGEDEKQGGIKGGTVRSCHKASMAIETVCAGPHLVHPHQLG